MAFTVNYLPEVLNDDLQPLPKKIQKRILKAIEERLMTGPSVYGVRLRKSLSGYWKLRVGDYRIVFTIRSSVVTVLKIERRKDVYKAAAKRSRGQDN